MSERDDLTEAALSAIREVCGTQRPVPLHEPSIGDAEVEAVSACLRSGWISTAGEASVAFERSLQEVTGVEHAVAVSNGTAALHLALIGAGVAAGDAVLVPALTFVATANAIHYCGATPHFVDSEAATFGVDADALRAHLEATADQRDGRCVDRASGRTIRALVAVHVFGHPVDLDALTALCDDFGIALVEDAAEALGTHYHGRHVGGHGRTAALSFNGNKIITTGGGGAILTRDASIAERLRHLSTTARTPHRWEAIHDEVGFNFRLPAVNAALGNAQLSRLPDYLAAKRRLAERYTEAFAGIDGVTIHTEQPEARSNHWLVSLVLDEADRAQRDAILEATNDDGIHTRPIWTLLAELPMYRACPSMPLESAKALCDRVISLPSSPCLAATTGEDSA